ISQTPFFDLFPDVFQKCLQSLITELLNEDEELLKKLYSSFYRLVKSQKTNLDIVVHTTRHLMADFSSTPDLFSAKLEFYEAVGYCFGLKNELSMKTFEDALDVSRLSVVCNVIRAAGAFLKGFNDALDKQAVF